MPISFNNIPNTQRVPLVYVEFDNTRAVQGTPAIQHKLLIVGQRLTTGTVAEGVPTLINSAAEGETFFGRGSMLAAMIEAAKSANRHTEMWAIGLDDATGGVQATGTITVTGAATASGSIPLYIGGKKISVAVASGDAATAIAAAINAAINADTSLPVTSTVLTTVVTMTCRWDGETGNDIDVRDSYYQGESLPAGVALAYSGFASGAANPDIATAITAMAGEQYHTMVIPFTDATNLTALETELADRWGPLQQIDGMAFTAYRGTVAATQTFGNGRNSAHVTCMATGVSPQAPYVWASVNAAVASASLSIDPARPLQTLALNNIMPPALTARHTRDERNTLLFDGIATHSVDAGGRVLIERQVTMYQTNAQSVPDTSYLDVNTPYTLSYLRYSLRARIALRFPRHKLASDGTRYGVGQTIVTPNVIKGELIALFGEWEESGLVENFEQFKDDLVVERDASDANRLNVQISPDLVNQFRIFASQIQFIV